jgi:hypothetical protein
MTTILDPALDLSLAPLTNTPLTSSDTTFEIADQVGDITNFPDPGVLGYYAWVWAREPNFPNVGDAARAGFAERVRVTARNLGPQTLTVTRDGVTPIDLNASGVTYWLVAPMNAKYIDDLDDRIFDFVAGNLVTTKDVQVATLFAEQVDLAVTTPGVGLLRFLEDTVNGISAVSLQSPAALAGDVAMTLLDALPAGLEFLQIDAAGLMTTVASLATVSLDDAYDEGGPGLGRIVLSTDGPVESAGDGFQSTGLPAVYLFETTDASFNFRMAATANDLLFQSGDQDTDVSDDSFETIFAIDGVTRRVGTNTTNPQDLFHVNAIATGTARVRIQALDAASDVSVLLNQAGTSVWEAGYDDSAAGYVIGRLTFANPAFFVEDATGRVGINTITPGAQFETLSSTAALINTFINQDANGVGLFIDSEATSEPLISLSPLATTNTRGDIAFGINRLVDPSGPSSGDLWFNFLDRDGLMLRSTSINRVVCSRRYAYDTGPTSILTLVGGLINPSVGVQSVRAEGGPGLDDLDNITLSSAYLEGAVVIFRAAAGDTITVRHNVGNIHLDGAANKVLINGNLLPLRFNGTDWEQLSPMMVLL